MFWVVGQVGQQTVDPIFCQVSSLLERVEQAEQVHFFAGLQLHAGQDRQFGAFGGLHDGAGVGAGVVVGDGEQVDALVQRFLHDQGRDHLHAGAGGKQGMDMQFGAQSF